MSLEEQAKAQVATLVDELGLTWGADGLSEKAAGVVVDLVTGLKGPADYVRLVQALCVPADQPDARERESIRAIRQAIRQRSETLGGGGDGVLWCQVVAGAVVRVVPNEKLEQLTWPARCTRRPPGTDGVSKRLMTLLSTIDFDGLSDRVDVPNFKLSLPPQPKKRAGLVWSSVNKALDAIQEGNLVLTDSRNGQVQALGIVQIATALKGAIRELNGLAAVDNQQALDQIQWLATGLQQLIKQIESSLEVAFAPDRETDALWWGQALYSKRQHASYRDIKTPALPWLMADDLLDALGPTADESVVAWYTETLRRLWSDIDAEKTWAEHLDALLFGLADAAPEPLPQGLVELIRKEATALPITRLLARVPGETGAAVAERSGAGAEPVKGVIVARQLFRERALARWFAEEAE